jgi:hypothetical protein
MEDEVAALVRALIICCSRFLIISKGYRQRFRHVQGWLYVLSFTSVTVVKLIPLHHSRW